MGTLSILGFGSALFTTLGFLIYVRYIVAGKTKPERASWWIWTILMAVAFAAQAAAGATWSLLFTGALLFGNLIIAILSLKYGYGHLKPRDYLALVFTFAGLYLWKITGNPISALLVIICIDFIGNWLTIIKTWRAPYSESVLAWSFTTVGAVFGVLAVGSFNLTRLLFPIYVIIPNLMTIGVIKYRRKWRASQIKSGRRKHKS